MACDSLVEIAVSFFNEIRREKIAVMLGLATFDCTGTVIGRKLALHQRIWGGWEPRILRLRGWGKILSPQKPRLRGGFGHVPLESLEQDTSSP